MQKIKKNKDYTPFKVILTLWPYFPVLCNISSQLICFIYDHLYFLFSYSCFTPSSFLLPIDNHEFVLCICEFFFCFVIFIKLFYFYIPHKSDNIQAIILNETKQVQRKVYLWLAVFPVILYAKVKYRKDNLEIKDIYYQWCMWKNRVDIKNKWCQYRRDEKLVAPLQVCLLFRLEQC